MQEKRNDIFVNDHKVSGSAYRLVRQGHQEMLHQTQHPGMGCLMLNTRVVPASSPSPQSSTAAYHHCTLLLNSKLDVRIVNPSIGLENVPSIARLTIRTSPPSASQGVLDSTAGLAHQDQRGCERQVSGMRRRVAAAERTHAAGPPLLTTARARAPSPQVASHLPRADAHTA